MNFIYFGIVDLQQFPEGSTDPWILNLNYSASELGFYCPTWRPFRSSQQIPRGLWDMVWKPLHRRLWEEIIASLHRPGWDLCLFSAQHKAASAPSFPLLQPHWKSRTTDPPQTERNRSTYNQKCMEEGETWFQTISYFQSLSSTHHFRAYFQNSVLPPQHRRWLS